MRAHILSTILFVVSAAATVPQLYQTLTTGQTRDFNVWSLILNMITNILLGLHGYFTGDIGLFLVGTWFMIYWSILFSFKVAPRISPKV
jgi:hypothetical protein